MWMNHLCLNYLTDQYIKKINFAFTNMPIVYTHGLTNLCIFALRIMGLHYFQATFTILQVHDR